MTWTGEEFWAQRLQDWCVMDGELHCLVHGNDRTINLLTHQLSGTGEAFTAEMIFRFGNDTRTGYGTTEHYAGFRLGLKGRFKDYRSAIFTGKGINAGVGRNGKLFIGRKEAEKDIPEKILTEQLRLVLTVKPVTGGHYSKLTVFDKAGNTITSVNTAELNAEDWSGMIALVSHCKNQNPAENKTSVIIKDFSIRGEKLAYHPGQVFGPVYFAQYSLHRKVLKMTAQLAPVESVCKKITLLVKRNNTWKEIASSAVHPLARTANFRVENWKENTGIPYRVSCSLVLTDGKSKTYSYEGTIAAVPETHELKALAFSCNWDYAFPDNEVVEHASRLNADMVFFLGDQFYEPNGGFGVQMAPLEKSSLDYLRKWYMFGWSYRELFRHRPMAALPDDHDMYHGNIWGAGGRATIATGGGAARQDSGGYKMPAEWVNMAQLTQTGHMPDPFDPTPVLQGINVYYTEWDYAGISFGIIEDRKFKSPPKDILPPDAAVFNGYAENPGYDHSKTKALEAHLLGERQMRFLSSWTGREPEDCLYRVLVSATPFSCLQTLPAGSKNDQGTPDLPIPEKGEYVQGDLPTQDMDSNGWPHNRRDEVLKLLDKKVDLHLTGDQHLPSVIKYGVETYGDSMFCFAVPALCNLWPRRWWPPLKEDHRPLPGKPRYTGDFTDGFGNRMTVHAVANPCKSEKKPALIYDRVTGYGLVVFDKEKKQITLNCWPRYADPLREDTQYEGWPVTINF